MHLPPRAKRCRSSPRLVTIVNFSFIIPPFLTSPCPAVLRMSSVMPAPTSMPLGQHSVPVDPLEIFRQWYHAARSLAFSEPGAMSLATVNAEGQPSARMVRLNRFDAARFVFYTIY